MKFNFSKNPLRFATYLALFTAVISGTNNFFTKIAVTVIKDPIFYTTLKNALVAVFFIGVVLALKKIPEILSLTRRQLMMLLAIGVVGGSVPFALFFTGLQKTSAINAGLIHKTLFIWVLFMAMPILGERLRPQQWFGVTAIFAANLFIGGFVGFKYNSGELMILAATILWAIENVIAKIALRNISSVTVASARMVLGTLALFGFLLWQGVQFETMLNLNGTQWGWTLLTSFLLFGYVISWYTALKHAPATYVAALLVPATLVTNVLSAIFITGSLTIQQTISYLLFIAGLILMIKFAKETAETAPLQISGASQRL